MTDSTEYTACDRWLTALCSDLYPDADPEFRRHLAECETCRREWADMQRLWGTLAMDSEEVEVPEELKDEVMDAIFGPTAKKPRTFVWERPRRRRIVWVSAAAACLAIGIAAGALLSGGFHPNPKASTNASDLHLQREWSLTSFDPGMPQAKGTISLFAEGDLRRVVIDTSGLRPTQGEEAYQVWLVYDGARSNCGTFRVDNSGKGALIYDIRRANLSIDSFGITLEPDDQGSQPRGKKVAGTNTITYREEGPDHEVY